MSGIFQDYQYEVSEEWVSISDRPLICAYTQQQKDYENLVVYRRINANSTTGYLETANIVGITVFKSLG